MITATATPRSANHFTRRRFKRRGRSKVVSSNFINCTGAAVVSPSPSIAFSSGEPSQLTGGVPDALKTGDVIAVAPAGNGWRLRTVLEVSGGFVAEDTHTGRVLAMQGGFDFRLSDFNRATQANRQPGSTIKPFVYAAGLDGGMTPATLVPDSQYCYYQGSNLGEKCFTNFGGSRGGGGDPQGEPVRSSTENDFDDDIPF